MLIICPFPRSLVLAPMRRFVLQGSYMGSPDWLTSDQLQIVDPLFLVILIQPR